LIGELRRIEDTNRFLNQEIERLNKELLSLKAENTQLKYHYVEYSSLQVKLNEMLGLSVLLFTEIESLRFRVQDKESEIAEIRRTSFLTHKQN